MDSTNSPCSDQVLLVPVPPLKCCSIIHLFRTNRDLTPFLLVHTLVSRVDSTSLLDGLVSFLLSCPAADAAYPQPFADYQRPGTPGAQGSSMRYQHHPSAAGNIAQSQSLAHPGYPHQYTHRDSGAQSFIPTPSQAMEYRQYADRQSHRRSGSVSSPLNPGYNHPSPAATQHPPVVPPSQHYPSQYASTSAAAMNYASTGDRSVCHECDASFSRPHDLRRHFETQHLESPPIHRCQHCQKEFSRSDSLKRHLDKRCETRDNN
jgi:hypothetical protein